MNGRPSRDNVVYRRAQNGTFGFHPAGRLLSIHFNFAFLSLASIKILSVSLLEFDLSFAYQHIMVLEWLEPDPVRGSTSDEKEEKLSFC